MHMLSILFYMPIPKLYDVVAFLVQARAHYNAQLRDKS